jgi:RNA polymerase sigma-70 factor (ECF subfamily)
MRPDGKSEAKSHKQAERHTPGELAALADGELLAAVFSRSELAWRELLRRFRPLMFRCIHKVALKHEAHLGAEDINEIFSEVCCNLLRDDMRKLRAWDPARGSKLSTWLGLLSMNTAYDFLRANRRRPLLDKLENAPERPTPEPSALDELLDRERWGYVTTLLSDFSEKDRRFVELYYARGMLPEEVAAAMRISVKTVYSKKNKLRSKLEALALQDPDAPTRRDAPAPVGSRSRLAA